MASSEQPTTVAMPAFVEFATYSGLVVHRVGASYQYGDDDFDISDSGLIQARGDGPFQASSYPSGVSCIIPRGGMLRGVAQLPCYVTETGLQPPLLLVYIDVLALRAAPFAANCNAVQQQHVVEADHFHIYYPPGGVTKSDYVALVDRVTWVACTTGTGTRPAASGKPPTGTLTGEDHNDQFGRDAGKAPCDDHDLIGIADVKIVMLYKAMAAVYKHLRSLEERLFADDILTYIAIHKPTLVSLVANSLPRARRALVLLRSTDNVPLGGTLFTIIGSAMYALADRLGVELVEGSRGSGVGP
jgi:hypothetical protein